MDTQELVLQQWEALEKRYLELNPAAAKARRAANSDLLKTIKRGLTIPVVNKLVGFEEAWEVDFAGIKVSYFGFDAETKARKFAKDLASDNSISDQNLEAARQFVNSCENWKDYDNDENMSKFVEALMLVRPLTVGKIWTCFRAMVDSGELRPAVC